MIADGERSEKRMSNRKVLLMGKSGSGKTSMRSIIFANYIARDTNRLGPTMEVEHAHVRFLGNLVLHLWDCGGQEAFMANYLISQRDQIFKNVQVLIYVFDVESRDLETDYRYYQSCLEALIPNSPNAKVFCLIHKMDLVSEEHRDQVFAEKEREILCRSKVSAMNCGHYGHDVVRQCYRSSIWDETLYKAWSAIVCHLVPNVASMEARLKQFAVILDADEVLLFEKATFLVIAQAQIVQHEDVHRFEKVSNIIKQFKLSCSKLGSQFECMCVRNSKFAAFIDSFTCNTFIMVVLSDATVSSAATLMNIRNARKHFEKLEARCNNKNRQHCLFPYDLDNFSGMIWDVSLWSAGSVVFPVLIFCLMYHMARPFLKVMVNCWFCNENIRVPYYSRKAFVCPKCGQYNGFKEDGDYDRFIPEQKYEFLNPTPEKRDINNIKIIENRESATTSGLCQRCNVQQARVQSQINKFEPRNEANFDGEFEIYKTRLRKSYPLCNDCEQVVRRKLELDKKFGLNQLQIGRTVSVSTPIHRYNQPSQKNTSEISEVPRHGRSHRRYPAVLFNCGPIANCLNLITFSSSCCLFVAYLLQLQNNTTAYFDLSQLLPCYVLSSWIPFLMLHISKIILLGLGSHITSVIVMHARRSLPDIVTFFIWCVLLFLKNSDGEKQELLLSQLSFVSILCIVSFAVAFFPRKLLRRKRPNRIIQSAFSIASTPMSQCSTLSAHTNRSVSFSGNARDRSFSSRESTPARELGKLFNSLSLGDDLSLSKGMSITQQRRGPFDSMKKPILAEPRLRISDDAREGMFLRNRMHLPTTRYISCKMGIKGLKGGIRLDVYQFKIFGAEMLGISCVLN
ncbi:unnamed protein product [Litomosoides sigmodontis]|uniref:Ima1 N-terminal domain-containing protein n=1 Tax=Litomosoides sigmodontis TaxID=42156 RepID=A0A3P6U9I6_LITSI|nr:unnamed protein product [Litomosoides sigmodontis]